MRTTKRSVIEELKKRRKPPPPPAPEPPPTAPREESRAPRTPQEFIDGLLAAELQQEAQREAERAMLKGPARSELQFEDLSALSPEQFWTIQQGWTPLEFLVNTYRNPYVRTTDRIAAARATLEYIHRNIPRAGLLGMDPRNPIPPGVLTPTGAVLNVKRLSDKELEMLERLLAKMESEADNEGV